MMMPGNRNDGTERACESLRRLNRWFGPSLSLTARRSMTVWVIVL